ncbi:MAG: hypothetical protein R3327_05310 [Nitrosopumilaceae archaeon]|nr:hypothetical protein [Nitrosopumilaceae archaeon]
MNETTDKIDTLVSQNRIKLHVFEPSNRKIWTVVGKAKEHWLDPDMKFCSCPSYYFGRLNGKKFCYHIEAQKIAEKQGKFETIVFSDDEFYDFIKSVINEL